MSVMRYAADADIEKNIPFNISQFDRLFLCIR